ncbi:Transcriptional regulator, MarR family [Actinokineospora spheciospongiae]|uniref:Transcriptional regulator, MarR family n=1 Tax=Actinokineospora spheciospongiae TaxID=909613 RepID=W7IME0_9PSEU|nr:MarR family transcriptional regulator [Actinokineospora spheciospongiae]EWC61533.1 Transcriptional regulator, MarR family [Actinokineospora spheciospongiae]PWW61793.1 DNA-binding MarR family transcriptional regulator [Actinokineospora spheciospongiae]
MADAQRAAEPNPTDSDAPDPADLRTADQLGLQLVRFLRLSNHAKQHFTSKAKHAIERSNYALLATLVHTGPLRANALAEAIHSDPSTVSRQVGALVGQGLVERQTDPDDGRACVLVPTEEGVRAFRANHDRRTRQIARMLAEWSEDDRRTLVHLLTRLNTEIEKFQGEDR